MNWERLHQRRKRAWKFLWDDDSVWSWLANLIIAFLLIRFVVYPLLGLILGTSYPIVAVVSESMEHEPSLGIICGQYPLQDFKYSFTQYWKFCGSWYEEKGITKEKFQSFPFTDGFDKGDVIILWRPTHLNVGDILIFQGSRPQPIIHRIVNINKDGSYQTKGDHNSNSIPGSGGELQITQDRILGKGLVRIPYLGWVKILFVDAVMPLGIKIER